MYEHNAYHHNQTSVAPGSVQRFQHPMPANMSQFQRGQEYHIQARNLNEAAQNITELASRGTSMPFSSTLSAHNTCVTTSTRAGNAPRTDGNHDIRTLQPDHLALSQWHTACEANDRDEQIAWESQACDATSGATPDLMEMSSKTNKDMDEEMFDGDNSQEIEYTGTEVHSEFHKEQEEDYTYSPRFFSHSLPRSILPSKSYASDAIPRKPQNYGYSRMARHYHTSKLGTYPDPYIPPFSVPAPLLSPPQHPAFQDACRCNGFRNPAVSFELESVPHGNLPTSNISYSAGYKQGSFRPPSSDRPTIEAYKLAMIWKVKAENEAAKRAADDLATQRALEEFDRKDPPRTFYGPGFEVQGIRSANYSRYDLNVDPKEYGPFIEANTWAVMAPNSEEFPALTNWHKEHMKCDPPNCNAWIKPWGWEPLSEPDGILFSAREPEKRRYKIVHQMPDEDAQVVAKVYGEEKADLGIYPAMGSGRWLYN
jgi:hypothetical protein